MAAVAAAAFSRSRSHATDIAFSPVTGADLAAAALTAAGPAPAAALDPATPAPGTTAPGTTAPATAIQQAPSNEVPSEAGADMTATDKTDKNATDKKATQTTAAAAAGGGSVGVRALVFARAAIGKPYRYGAAGPNAFDCSGLVMSAFRKAGVRLPRTSAAQSKAGTAVRRDQLQPGSLLFARRI